MESKAMFDLDESSKSIIVLDINYNGDVRDKIAKRFVAGLDSESAWCNILYTGNNKYVISPIGLNDLREQAQRMIALADSLGMADSK